MSWIKKILNLLIYRKIIEILNLLICGEIIGTVKTKVSNTKSIN